MPTISIKDFHKSQGRWFPSQVLEQDTEFQVAINVCLSGCVKCVDKGFCQMIMSKYM